MKARELLQRATGLSLSAAIVERAVRQRMQRRAIAERADYLDALSPDELKALIELVVVPESWMFRDAEAFAAATAFVRGRLAARPERTVRILSIPCAGGEEPYSMAMALADAGIAPAACAIDGVDLSAVAIERARRGLYTRNAFRSHDLAFRDRYFEQAGDEYQIAGQIRERVRFSEGNLMTFDGGIGAYDLIFCRNLLIYFDEPTTARAIARLHALLADDGLLFAGYAEVPSYCRYDFAPLRLPGAFALKKAGPSAGAVPRAYAPLRAPAAPAPARAGAAPAPKAAPKAARPARPAAQAPPAADAGALLAQARRQADQRDFAGAAASCHAALAAAPDAAEAYFILGLVSECEQKPAQAADFWRRCVYLQPGHYEALCHLALLAEQGGDAPAASLFRQRAARIYQRRQDGANRGVER